MRTHHTSHAFTLVEMLVVITIIGVLAVALIPRLVGIQARARDTTRTTDTRTLTQALQIYTVDYNSGYPPAFHSQGMTHAPVYTFSASTTPYLMAPDRLLAQTSTPIEGTVEILKNALTGYITELPRDPSKRGISSSLSNESCATVGDTYAYYRDSNNTMYAITTIYE
jgi:prepilin-type N-terminal cleavage/methylation domain-containing protein